MGRHKDWRKLAKKTRRKKKRQEVAIARDEELKKEEEERLRCPEYQNWLLEQELLENFQREEEERIRVEEHRKWEEREVEAQRKWVQLQEAIAAQERERAEQEKLIREEWEKQEKEREAEEERKRVIEEEKKFHQERLIQDLDAFLEGYGEFPEEIRTPTETQPGKELCPFFSKTFACKFFSSCSRNHVRPGVSTIVLLPGFYTHFSLTHTQDNEYDTDITLEYETSEQYSHFVDFFKDIFPELSKYGRIYDLKVCINKEPHLRGNVYIEYSSEREAVKAYRSLNGRYYAGKCISAVFASIPSWKNAVCGLYFRKKCPKGNACNFMHVLRNPRGYIKERHLENKETNGTPMSHWRWSESPEPVVRRRRSKSRSRERSSSRKDRKSSRRHRSRSRSREKKKKRKSDRSSRRSSSKERRRSRQSLARENR